MNVPERLLLGPGPSPVSSRVMQAMGSPVLSHLDPAMVALLDGVRQRLASAFGAGDGALNLATSGTGTSGMEAAVSNLAKPGTRALVVVTGYFGDRLAQMLERYGATVSRVQVEWGRACDPSQVERALAEPTDIVAMVHGETSTGVVNPVEAIAAIAQAHGALTIVDAVTTLGGVPLKTGAWGIDACYSCTQKGLGAPSGLAPITFSSRALERRAPSRSFYLDITLLEDFWLRRKYHHTISAPLVYALHEALGVSLLPPPAERLWTLNAVRVPDGIDEATVRRRLLDEFGIEIGAGLGPLAGKIWRVGLMGAGSTRSNILLFLSAFERVLRAAGHRSGSESAALAAAERVVAAV